MKLFGKMVPSIFFWTKKKQTEVQKAEEMIQLYVKYIPELKRIMRESNTFVDDSDGDFIGRMYDFYADAYGGNTAINFAVPARIQPVTAEMFPLGDVAPNGLDVPLQYMQPKDERKEAKPVDVVAELETVPTPFTMEGLDEKIEMFRDKSKISTQRYAKAQIDGFLKRLENRKFYTDNIEFYSLFQNTTDDKIDKLLANYKLEMNESELFIPTFPKEATDVMKKYTEVTEKVTGEKPVFYVIAELKDFKKKREKLDPILLAQSPFGFYWQILGAWDKEMLLLTEL